MPGTKQLKQSICEQILASKWPGYVYGYPHKKAYRLVEHLDMAEVWSKPLETLNLYVHVPFCESRCAYCNLFTLPTGKRNHKGIEEYTERYVDAVVRQTESYRPLFANANPKILSVYFGGGTPNYLSLGRLGRIFSELKRAFPNWDQSVEPSIECSPYLLDEEYIRGMEEIGFRRVSLGMQSFDDGDLKVMNRHTSAARFLELYDLVTQAGLNTNIDIIYGLPGQSMGAMLKNLYAALNLSPKTANINLYPLTIRKLTGMERIAQNDQTSGGERHEFLDAACRILADHGYVQESGIRFALANGNSTYKQQILELEGVCTLGLGSGARSYAPKVNYAQPYKIKAKPTKEVLDAYVNADFARGVPFEAFFLNQDELKRRSVIFGLLGAGLDTLKYRAEYGELPEESYPSEFQALDELELITKAENVVTLTTTGKRYYDIAVNAFESEEVKKLKEEYNLE